MAYLQEKSLAFKQLEELMLEVLLAQE